MARLEYGLIPEGLDTRDYTLVDSLRQVGQGIFLLDEKDLQIGLGKPLSNEISRNLEVKTIAVSQLQEVFENTKHKINQSEEECAKCIKCKDKDSHLLETHPIVIPLNLPDQKKLPVNFTTTLEINEFYKYYFYQHDYSEFWSEVDDQKPFLTCVAHAGAALLEYLHRRADTGRNTSRISRRFLYVVARKLMKRNKGSLSLSIRSMVEAMVIFGSPPEEYERDRELWFNQASSLLLEIAGKGDLSEEILDKHLNQEPDQFSYTLAQKYKATSYFRLDREGLSSRNLIDQIKVFIIAHLPPMFGVKLFHSLEQTESKGYFPYPIIDEMDRFGHHSLVAIGYDDKKEIKNKTKVSEKDWNDLVEDIVDTHNLSPEEVEKFIKYKNGKIHTTGAFQIRNSWGTNWGEQGYGWLPYAYVLTGLTFDWWSILKAEWLDSKYFGLFNENGHLVGDDCPKPCHDPKNP